VSDASSTTTLRSVVVAVGDRRGIADSSHRDRLRYRGRETRRNEDRPVASSRHDPEDDPEDVDQPVLAAQDHVAEHVLVGVVAVTTANSQQ
jgi:hypothetical protein